MNIDKTTQKVNKEDLISRVSAEFLAQYIAQATGSTVKRDGNGYRVGHNRGISVSMKNGVAIWHDFTTEIGGTFVEAVYVFEKGGADSQIPPTDYPAVLESAARTLSIPLPVQQQPIIESEKPAVTDDVKIAQIAVIKERYYTKWQEGLKTDAAQNILNKRGINPLLIDTTHIGYTERSIFSWGSKTPKIDDAFIFWNPDFSAFKTMRFDHETGHRVKETFGTMTFCAQSGDYFFSPDGVTEGESVTLVESEFDALLLKSYGIPSIALKATPNNSSKIKFNATFLLYDNDDAGDGFTKKAKSCIRKAKDYRHFVSINGFKSKDIGDLLEGLTQDIRSSFMQNLKNVLTIVDDDYADASLKKECIYLKRPFTDNDDRFTLSKELFDSSPDYDIIKELNSCYKVRGICNGRLVIKKDGKLLAVTRDQLLGFTIFETAKRGEFKRIRKGDREEIKYLLSQIYEENISNYIPIKPSIPNYANEKESEAYADRIEELYKDFVDKKGRPALKQYMRVIGYILSGEFWTNKEERFFINIVSRQKGMGKTKLLVESMLGNINVLMKSVLQEEEITRFSFADFCDCDVIAFNDITDENASKLTPLLTNIVSNAAARSERKSAQSERFEEVKSLVIVTGNKELIINESTGICKDKRLLIKMDDTREEEGEERRAYLKKTSRALIRDAKEKPGIEAAFLNRCIREYEANPKISDLLCSETKSEKDSALFDTFRALYGLTPVKSIKNGMIDIAKAFSESLEKDSTKDLFRRETGKLSYDDIRKAYFKIIQSIKLIKSIGIAFKPRCLVREMVDGVCWSGKSRQKVEELNLAISTEDWNKLQSWLRSIDPELDDDDDEINDSKKEEESKEPSPYEKFCTENAINDPEIKQDYRTSFLEQHGYDDSEF